MSSTTSSVMNVSHDHFGNLRRTSQMTTERYGKKSIQNESQIENRQNL